MKYLISIIVLLMLAGGVYVMQYDGEDIRKELVLHVSDTSNVQHIRIINRDSPSFEFSRKRGIWINEDGSYVRKDAIDNLLMTLNRQRVSSLVPKPALDNVVKDLSTQSVKVDVLDGNKESIISFYVGGVTPDERGTFMIREGSDIPVIVNIPGFEGGLRTRYIMSKNDWESRELIPDLNEISVLEIEYPSRQDQSFRIRKNNRNNPEISKLGGTKREFHTFNKYLLLELQRRLKNLYSEAVLPEDNRAKIHKSIPFCRMYIRNIDGEEIRLEFYPKAWVDYEDPGVVKKQIERYYTLRGDGKLFLTQHLLMQKIFVGYEHFVPSGVSESEI